MTPNWEFFVFWDKSVAGISIVRVDQFAKYKEKLKRGSTTSMNTDISIPTVNDTKLGVFCFLG